MLSSFFRSLDHTLITILRIKRTLKGHCSYKQLVITLHGMLPSGMFYNAFFVHLRNPNNIVRSLSNVSLDTVIVNVYQILQLNKPKRYTLCACYFRFVCLFRHSELKAKPLSSVMVQALLQRSRNVSRQELTILWVICTASKPNIVLFLS